jgi:pyruvate kinase
MATRPKLRRRRRTKIIATLGPASSSPEVLTRLFQAGADVFRLNFSHGTHEDHAARFAMIRQLEDRFERPIGILADVQGPKLRVGRFSGGRVHLQTGQAFRLDLNPTPGSASRVNLPHPEIIEAASIGCALLLDDGKLRLRVARKLPDALETEVVVGGPLSDHKGVNVPDVVLPIPALTAKDRNDLAFALQQGANYIGLSFVQRPEDVAQAKELIGGRAWVMVKLEKPQALENLDAIMHLTDAVMVARGDLGVEIGAATVPLLQKRIILRCLEAGKPVITATQMLESMIEHAEPTRAEASDVANAILDGTSAIMLSAETATGNYPVEAVRTMDSIARAVEPSMGYRHQMPTPGEETTVGRAMSNAACDLAEALGARAILVPTFTGRTASAVARLRPRRPVIGLSHHQTSVQQMALEWGVTPVLMPQSDDVEDLWSRSIDSALKSGTIDAGDRVVLTAGTAVNLPGSTNVIKVDVA